MCQFQWTLYTHIAVTASKSYCYCLDARANSTFGKFSIKIKVSAIFE